MTVQKNKAVTLNYRLTDDQGELIDESSDGSFCYLHGHNNIVPGLEKAVDGKKQGDTFSVVVTPNEGYGERDDSRIETVARDMFPADEEVQVGMQFHAEGPNKEIITITILEVSDSEVKIDSNDDLAGVTLHFDVEVVAIRDAEESEIAHGHIHHEHVHDENCQH